MSGIGSLIPLDIRGGYQHWLRDAQLGMQNLLLHGMRSLLTMLGMIFGVAAVVAMLSIGSSSRQKKPRNGRPIPKFARSPRV